MCAIEIRWLRDQNSRWQQMECKAGGGFLGALWKRGPLILMLEDEQRKNELCRVKIGTYQGTGTAQEAARRWGYAKGQMGTNGGNVGSQNLLLFVCFTSHLAVTWSESRFLLGLQGADPCDHMC